MDVPMQEDDWYKSTSEDEECMAARGDYQKPGLPLMSEMDVMYSDTKDIDSRVNRFNLWASILGNRASSSRPWIRGERALNIKEEIDQLAKQIHDKIEDLQHAVSSFQHGVSMHADVEWWRQVEDLTDHDPLELETGLMEHPQYHPRGGGPYERISPIEIHNFPDYVAYLEQLLPRAARRSNALMTGHSFISNVHTLIDKVAEGGPWSKDSEHFQLRLWVLVKAQVLRPDRPRLETAGQMKLQEEHTRASHAIRDVLDLSDELGDEFGSDITYWNYALSFRRLWAAWHEPKWDEVDGGNWNPQWQRLCVTPLRIVHRKAIKEIREATELALNPVADKLPVELRDLIFETTLEVEGVPLTLPQAAFANMAGYRRHDDSD